MRKRTFDLPPFYLVLAIGLLVVMHRHLPIAEFGGVIADRVGTILMAAGVMLILVCMAAFARARTGIVPFSEATQVVRSGPYRVSRNPMYLGMVILLLGGALKAGTLGALLPVPLLAMVLHHRFILPEEHFLESALGEDYLDYRRSVRRWL